MLNVQSKFYASNPLGVSGNYDRLPFAPYFIFKDLVTIFIFILVLSVFVFLFGVFSFSGSLFSFSSSISFLPPFSQSTQTISKKDGEVGSKHRVQ